MRSVIHRLQNGRVRLLLSVILSFFLFSASAQVRISGKVTDAGGQGVAGISVLLRNTQYGASTDASGDYTITADVKPGTYTLEFSGVGYKARSQTLQITSGNNSYTTSVQLAEDALGLEEVVVTGTSQGTTRRQLGNYISTVRADQLNKGATGDVLSALQGKTAGAQIIQNGGDPAGGVSVRLRGISSVNSSSEPLYIVDGIIVNNATNRVTNTSANYDGQNFVGAIGQNRMSDINPADIERIEVLNGAAAAAIYGSRANAGVIQIFTKRGSTGAPVVSFSSNFMLSELRKKLDVNQAPVKFGGSPDVFTQDILSPAITTTSPVTRYDYQDYIFRTALGTDNNISVSGGRDRTRYYASGSYFYNQGIVQNTDFRRYSFRFNLDQTLNDVISFNVGLNYINSGGEEKPNGQSFFSPTNSVTIIGNFHNIWERDALGNIKAVGERGRVNPVSVIEDFKQRQETNRILSNLGVRLRPLKNLTFDYTLGIDNYSQNGTTFIPPFAYNVNTAFYGGGVSLDATLNGYSSTATNNFFQINNELNGNYTLDISNNLGSTTQVGYSVQYEKNNYILLQGRGLAPGVESVNSAATILPGVDDRSEISISGGYLQQNFKYKNHFFLTGAVRLDGSSVFGEDERNQVYYKASGSYLLSETDYWQNLGVEDWWNTFKLRAAYGESGNLTGIGAYQRINAYTPYALTGKISFNASNTLANEAIKPERQKELEIGTDLSFLSNRLGIQFNWYRKRVEDLLISRFVAPTTGYASFLDNIGSLENKGIELVVNASPVNTSNLRWDVTAIYNRNRNKAVNIGQALILFSTNAGAPVAILQGQPIGVFYGTFFATDEAGNQVKTASGIPQQERGIQNSPTQYTPQRGTNGLPLSTATPLRKVIGDPNPDYTGSLINEVSFRKLNLRIQLDAVQGVDVFNADFRTRQGVGNGKVAEQEHLGQLPRGYINTIYAVEEWRIDDGSFVKLREASLSYNFGNVKWFRDLRVNLSGRNLISWDDYDGYDPEVNAAGQSTILRGIDFGAIPIPRTFSIGVSTKF